MKKKKEFTVNQILYKRIQVEIAEIKTKITEIKNLINQFTYR